MTATEVRPEGIHHDDLVVIPDAPSPYEPDVGPLEVAADHPEPARRSRTGRRALATVTCLAVGFVVWGLLLSALPYARHQRALERDFAAAASQGLAPVNQPIAAGTPIARLRIPAIGLDATVVEGSEARQLAAAPGHLRTSVLPGQSGVSVILGRRHTHGAPFGDLDQLQRGDTIRVVNGQGTWTYRVAFHRTVPADDATAFRASGDTLLLVTSDGLTAGHRLVVTARAPKGLGQTGTPTNAGPVTGAELGLQGDPTASTGLLVWTQVLVLAAAGTVVLHRRWGRWPTWLIAAPVLAAALWSVYEQAALLLPAAF